MNPYSIFLGTRSYQNFMCKQLLLPALTGGLSVDWSSVEADVDSGDCDVLAQDVTVLLSFYKLVSYTRYQIIKLYPKQSELSPL